MRRKAVSILTVMTILMCIFSINVGAEREVLSFSRESISLFENQSFQLDLNADPDEVRYSSSDPDIVSINSTGKVTAVSLYRDKYHMSRSVFYRFVAEETGV